MNMFKTLDTMSKPVTFGAPPVEADLAISDGTSAPVSAEQVGQGDAPEPEPTPERADMAAAVIVDAGSLSPAIATGSEGDVLRLFREAEITTDEAAVLLATLRELRLIDERRSAELFSLAKRAEGERSAAADDVGPDEEGAIT